MTSKTFIFLYFGILWYIGVFAETDYDAIEALDDLDEIEPEQEEFTVTHEQYCDGCKTMMEGYFFAINREIKKNSKTPDALIDGAKVAEKLCHSDSFEPFDQYIKRSCAKLMNEHHKDLVMPLAGQVNLQTGLLMQDVGRHLKKACKLVGACSKEMVYPNYGKKTKCDACKVVANDIDFVIRREEKITTARIEDLLDEVCRYLPLRHDEPGFLEDTCFSMMDDLSDHLPSLLENYDNQRRSGAKSVTTIADEVCHKRMKLCTTSQSNSHGQSKTERMATKETSKRINQNKQSGPSRSHMPKSQKSPNKPLGSESNAQGTKASEQRPSKGKIVEDMPDNNGVYKESQQNTPKTDPTPNDLSGTIEDIELIDGDMTNDKDEL